MRTRSSGTSILAVKPRRSAIPLIFLVVPFLFVLTSPSAKAQGEDLYQKWEEVSSLRATGQFEKAIEVLKGIIQEYSDTDEVLRLAYNNLVYTYYVANDAASQEAAAREALVRFPDLRADDVRFPATINEGYERLRGEMFGSLVINKPIGARVFVDGNHKGDTPITLPLVPVGRHELLVSKSGYTDHTEAVDIGPGVVRQLEVSLDRQKDKWWWLTRVGAPVAALAAGIALAFTAGGDEGTTPEPQPLPEPPPPPGQ